MLSMLAFAIDVQTGVPRVWTGIGAGALVAGSFLLYDGVSISWITLLVGIGGVLLFMLGGMPAMVRTRFSTPTIGRDWMVGEEGEAVAAVAPDGVVKIRGAPVAGPDQPGDAPRGRGPRTCGRGRRSAARGRAPRRGGQGLSALTKTAADLHLCSR